MMITGLLAGAAKTLVISMLSERVVLRVLVMLSEWAAAKSSNSLDDRLVIEMKTKLEADGKTLMLSAYITPHIHYCRWVVHG